MADVDDEASLSDTEPSTVEFPKKPVGGGGKNMGELIGEDIGKEAEANSRSE